MKVILINFIWSNFLWTFFGILHCICNSCCVWMYKIHMYINWKNMYINLYIYQCIWIWWITVTLHGDFLWLMLYKIDLCLYCKDVLFCNKKNINYLEKNEESSKHILKFVIQLYYVIIVRPCFKLYCSWRWCLSLIP